MPELTALPRCTVVQLSGVAPLRPIDVNAVEAVEADRFVARGIAYPIYAPLLLPDGAAAHMLRQQPGIAEAIGPFNRVTKAVITVGAWGPGLSTVYDALSERERQRYRRQGGCAEIAATSSMRRAGSSPATVGTYHRRRLGGAAPGTRRDTARRRRQASRCHVGSPEDPAIQRHRHGRECGRAPAGVKPDERAEFVPGSRPAGGRPHQARPVTEARFGLHPRSTTGGSDLPLRHFRSFVAGQQVRDSAVLAVMPWPLMPSLAHSPASCAGTGLSGGSMSAACSAATT